MSRFDIEDERDAGMLAERKEKTKRPHRYKVLLHNDDYTTMEFVIYILMNYFNKSEAEANHIMLQVHLKGIGVAGVYSKDVAETKAQEVLQDARTNGQPLLVTTEPEA